LCSGATPSAWNGSPDEQAGHGGTVHVERQTGEVVELLVVHEAVGVLHVVAPELAVDDRDRDAGARHTLGVQAAHAEARVLRALEPHARHQHDQRHTEYGDEGHG
jgi:hypothetical protein